MPLNRTLLELKRRPTNQLYAPIISQSNLIGIETINACLCHIPCFFSLNRTLLELKLPAVHLKSPEDLSLNRTLLELKLYFNADALKEPALSIEPYWNWNWIRMQGKAHAKPLNRTLLELKHRACFCQGWGQILSIEPYWNWNITRIRRLNECSTLNRTLLELKRIRSSCLR